MNRKLKKIIIQNNLAGFGGKIICDPPKTEFMQIFKYSSTASDSLIEHILTKIGILHGNFI